MTKTSTTTARWLFSTTWISSSLWDGLELVGKTVDFVTSTPGTNFVDVDYVEAIAIGNTFSVNPALITTTWTGGGALAPQTGTVT